MRKFEVGKKVRLKNPNNLNRIWNGSARQYLKAIVDEGNIAEITHNNCGELRIKFGKYISDYNIHYSLFEIVNEGEMMKPLENMLKQEAKLKAEVKEVQLKLNICQERIAYMKENKLESFDEKEFQAYKVLSIIEDNPNMSRHERAKLIAEIVK